MDIVPQQSKALRVVAYVRVSTDAQAAEDRLSLPEQVDQCLAHARERGWSVIEVVRESHTGADLDERPEMGRVRSMIARRDADAVLVWHPDRLSRDPDHRAVLRYEFKRTGAQWFAVTGYVSDGSVLGNAMDYVSGTGSAQELERLRARTQPARHRKMTGDPERGIPARPLGSQRVPYGLRWTDERRSDGRLKRERCEADPETVETLRLIFRWYDEGASLRRLDRKLRAVGIVPPDHGRTGSPVWSAPTLRKILTNENYVGIGYARTTDRRKQPDGKRRNEILPREQWVRLPDGTFPQVVDADLWHRVQDRLQQNRRECPPGNRAPEIGLLRRGLGVCGYCGKSLNVVLERGMPRYRCSPNNRTRHGCPAYTMNIGLLDGQVWGLVTHLLQTPEALEAKLFGEPRPDPTAAAIPLAEATLKRLEQERDRTQRRLRATDDDDLALAYEADLKAILAEVRAAEAGRQKLLAEREAWQAGQERRAGVLDYAAQLAAELDGLDWAGRRGVLLRLGSVVRLYRDDRVHGRWDLTTRWRPVNTPAVALDEGTGVGHVAGERDGRPATAWVRIGECMLPHVGEEELASLVAWTKEERQQERDIAAWEHGLRLDWERRYQEANAANPFTPT